MMNNSQISQGELLQTLQHPRTRKAAVYESFLLFFSTYFSHYIKYPLAEFHHEIFRIIEDESVQTFLLMAFRGSAKSTIITLSYLLWSILGKQQKNFIVLLSQTQQQAQLLLKNIREELEQNELLRRDFGPLFTRNAEWSQNSLVLAKYEAKILAASTEQSLRGVRHKEHRPDLIICDDIEDISSVKTKESRDKTFLFLTGEVIPAGNEGTRLIMVGNLLHDDSVMMRFIHKAQNNEIDAEVREYPLINKSEDCLWPERFSEQGLLRLRRNVGSDESWYREYLLRIINTTARPIWPEWIQYYDSSITFDYEFVGIGVDLAISQKQTADYTAAVPIAVVGNRNNYKFYVLPQILNARMTHLATLDALSNLLNSFSGWHKAQIYVEDVGYQSAVVEHLKERDLLAKPIRVHGDKHSRLAAVSHLPQSGKVFFPEHGAKELVNQLVNLGKESHDDLADAFSLCLGELSKKFRKQKMLRTFTHKPDGF